MKKILLIGGLFSFSLFSMDQQLSDSGFESNISDMSSASESSDYERSSFSDIDDIKEAVTDLQVRIGKGFKCGGQITSLTEVMTWFSADLQALDKQIEARNKKNKQTFLLMAKILQFQDEKIKRLE